MFSFAVDGGWLIDPIDGCHFHRISSVITQVIFFIRDESFAAPAPKTGAAAADAGGGVGSGGGGQSAAATPGQSDGGGASGAPLPLPSLSSSAAATATGGGGGGGGGNPFAASVDVPEGNGVKGRGGVKLAVLDQASTVVTLIPRPCTNFPFTRSKHTHCVLYTPLMLCIYI